MSLDTFVGLPLNQSIASAPWDSGDITWAAKTYLAGNGADVLKVTQVAPFAVLGNYTALAGHTGAAVFFKPLAGRATTNIVIGVYIDGDGALDEYAPGQAVRASLGAYGVLILRDMATSTETEIACVLTDGAEYCLEVSKTTNANGREYRANVYPVTGGVRGTLKATQTITVGTALTGKRVQIMAHDSNFPYVTISRVESADAIAGDTTAPVLSAPTATATTSSTATGTVATNEGGGTLYYLVSANATETAATIKASGGTQAVSATGTRTVNVTGIPAGATRRIHYVQDDAATPTPNTSNVVSSAEFTTPAPDTVAPTFAGGAAITPGAITASSLAFSYPAATDNVAVTGYQISKDSGANWVDNGAGLNGSFTGLAASATLPIWVRAYDNGATRNYSTPLQTTMTTSAATTGSFTSVKFENNTATGWPAGTAVYWEWYQTGRIGSAPVSVTRGNGTLGAGGTLTVTGCPIGAGFLLAAVRGASAALDKPFYQPGTVA